MDRFVQLHTTTFHAPANLNRDDTGRPKTATMGGVPRLRISSQCLKRAWRESDVCQHALIGHLGERTARIGAEIEEHLLKVGTNATEARFIAREFAGAFGTVEAENSKNPTHTKEMAFIPPEERATALRLAEERLTEIRLSPAAETKVKKSLAKAEEKAAEAEENAARKKLAGKILVRDDTAADVAMFGRMLASSPDFSREAAVSVAHAITTHKVVIEDDFYVALDDLKPPSEDVGAQFIGESGFGSGVFYGYLTVDRPLLIKNLRGDVALAKTALAALVEAAMTVSPSGKRTSYASYSRASYAMVERGNCAPRTLAGAFIQPVDQRSPKPNDLMAESIRCLRDTRAQFARAYPNDELSHTEFCVGESGTLPDVIAFATDGM
jgi:CRISPR system Cascade subunit CasC